MDLGTIAIIWLLLCGLVAWVATTKGKNGVTWFLLAIVISPLIAGLFALIMSPTPRPTTGAAPPANDPAPPRPTANVADELAKLVALRNSGELTPAEFARLRLNLVGGFAAGSENAVPGWRHPTAPSPVASSWSTPAASSPIVTATPKEGRSGAETLVIGLILVAVVGGGILLLNGGRLPGTGTVDVEKAPPAGSIWFGDSYDPATFALTGQGNHVSAAQAVALVAHLSRPSRGEYLVVNVGDTTGSVPLGGGQIQSGFDLMAYLVPSDLLYSGTFTVTITDSGGNALASDFLYVD